jgi:hypothetical protein
MRGGRAAGRVSLAVVLAGLLVCALPAAAQQPMRASGQTVTPVFEGWYRNANGTYSLSFGYFNRNTEEVVEVPVGPNNFIEPDGPDRGQPTHFVPRRHWGVFAVEVPADFGERRVVWSLIVRGQKFSIPGSLKAGWEIDALEGEAGSGNTPPVLTFDPAGPQGRGPGGITGAKLAAKVGEPLMLTVWASDDGRSRRSIASEGRDDVPVTLTWFKHQGAGPVAFSNATPAVNADGKATTTATFQEPGTYMLRVRANDASGLDNAGHAQCCWTNSFVQVTVTR